jgi:hypothetical protein
VPGYPRENVEIAQGTPAANTAAVAKLSNPGAATRWTLIQVTGSYSATPAEGKLVITDGKNLTLTYYIPAAGPFDIPLGLPSGPGGENGVQEVTATLSAGGASVKGSVVLTASIQ